MTIAIPTFNRAAKLERLLTVLQEDITTSQLQERVVVLVSDNASTDETPSMLSQFADFDLRLEYYRQPENLGFDGNLRFLYAHVNTPYLWFMADDDYPLTGAVNKVVRALEAHEPDVLLFSFIQPPGSTVRQFDFPESVRLVTEPVLAIEYVLRYTKVSIFIVRKVSFEASQGQVLDENIGAGWYYISLAFSVLETSPSLRLAVISEALATCDEDYSLITTNPESLLRMGIVVQHPFVMKHSPNLPKFYRDEGYYSAIQFAFAVKCGALPPEYPEEYDKFIKELECRICTLFRCPRSLFQFMALKLRISRLWPLIKPKVRYLMSKIRV